MTACQVFFYLRLAVKRLTYGLGAGGYRKRRRNKENIINSQWPFDQAPNVAALTTRQVIKEDHPILRVAHYSDDRSWAFTCGTTDDEKDGRIASMNEIVKIDTSVL